jgi:uncharacterized protein with HEPN domain
MVARILKKITEIMEYVRNDKFCDVNLFHVSSLTVDIVVTILDMRPEEDQVHMNNIVRCIQEIDGYTQGMTQDSFNKDEAIQAIVGRNLMMIGNAAQMLSKEFKLYYSDIDFKVLESLRFANYNVDAEFNQSGVWDIVKNDLPFFKDALLTISSQMNSNRQDDDTLSNSDAAEWAFD